MNMMPKLMLLAGLLAGLVTISSAKSVGKLKDNSNGRFSLPPIQLTLPTAGLRADGGSLNIDTDAFKLPNIIMSLGENGEKIVKMLLNMSMSVEYNDVVMTNGLTSITGKLIANTGEAVQNRTLGLSMPVIKVPSINNLPSSEQCDYSVDIQMLAPLSMVKPESGPFSSLLNADALTKLMDTMTPMINGVLKAQSPMLVTKYFSGMMTDVCNSFASEL